LDDGRTDEKKAMTMNATVVLMTVNSPYSEKLDGEELAYCVRNPSAAKSKPGHVSSFFSEVSPEDQKEFAAAFGISTPVLVEAAKKFARYSGETYPLAS
jgi:hypothetical protein